MTAPARTDPQVAMDTFNLTSIIGPSTTTARIKVRAELKLCMGKRVVLSPGTPNECTAEQDAESGHWVVDMPRSRYITHSTRNAVSAFVDGWIALP